MRLLLLLLCNAFGFHRRLVFDPIVNVRLRKAPATTYLKGWDLVGTRQAVDGSLGDFQEISDFPDGHDGVVCCAGWHGLGHMGGSKRQHSAKFSICA